MSFETGQLIIGEPSTLVDRTNLIWDGGQLSFSATRGERGELNVELCLVPGESYDPQIGWPVWCYDPPQGQAGSECRFVGTIEDRDFGYIGDAGLEIISLSVLSLEQLYDTQPCPECEFPDGTDVATIVAFLFGSVTPPVAVSVGTIEGGFTLDKRTYDAKTNVWSAVKQLAVDVNKIAYIDPREQKFFFVASGSISSGFTLLTEDLLQNGTSPLVHLKQSRSDFRNRQITQAAPNIIPPVNAQFNCDGVTNTFTLPSQAQQVLGASLTTSVVGTATANFTGSPNDGDTVTVGGIVYTFRNAIDNSIPNEVLIDSGPGINLAAAINTTGAYLGSKYSMPTVRNPYASAESISSSTFTLRANAMGTTGNDVALTESCTGFSWSAATITGGANALGIALTVGVEGTGIYDLFYTPGTTAIRLLLTPGSGQSLTITYSGSGQVNVGNDQATVYAIGGQYQSSTPRNVSTSEGIQQQAGAILAGFSVMPGQFSFQTYRQGIYPGDTLPVALTVPADLAARVNGSWLVQDVRGEWPEGWETLPDDDPNRHFRCSVTCINSVQFNNYQNTLQRMLDVGGSNWPLSPPEEPITGGNDAQVLIYEVPIQIADTTVGDDKSPHISLATPIYSLSPFNYKVGQASRLQGVLRQVLTADLVVRINKLSFGSPTITSSWLFTFPSGWAVDDPIYVAIEGEIFNGDIVYIDIVSGPSPAVRDANGVASINLVWV